MLYREKTRILRRCFFDVQNEVGLGRDEGAYHQACKAWLTAKSIPFVSEAAHPLMLDGATAHVLHPDLVVWDQITVELKAVPRSLHDEEFVQLFNYLKCRSDRLGLLVNMGLDRVHVTRIVYDEPDYQLDEDWEYWTNAISGRDREVGAAVRDVLRTVFREHGTGYGSEVTAKLIQFGFARHGLPFVVAPMAASRFRGQPVGECPLDCTLVDGRVVLSFTSLFEDSTFCIRRGKSSLEALGLQWGIAANFGKRKAQFTGLRNAT